MDTYFPKTRRPSAALSTPIKRPPASITPPQAPKVPKTPTTPKDARLTRPLQPPPVHRKDRQPRLPDKRPITVRALFETVHPHDKNEVKATKLDTTHKIIKNKTTEDKDKVNNNINNNNNDDDSNVKDSNDNNNTNVKITQGPLKGVSTGLLDLIRAKEAEAKKLEPEHRTRLKLLGIAPEIVRIVPTVFTANKKEVMLYDKVVEKCIKGLHTNYTSSTITECLDLMDKVAPDWVSTVKISRGRFMRFNRDKYDYPQLLEAIRRYKRNLTTS